MVPPKKHETRMHTYIQKPQKKPKTITKTSEKKHPADPPELKKHPSVPKSPFGLHFGPSESVFRAEFYAFCTPNRTRF